MTLPPYVSAHKSGATLHLRVQPRCSRPGPLGLYGECLKWGIKAAPVDGKANEELIESLAETFEIAKRDVSIIRGETSREKVVLLNGMSTESVRQFLQLQT